MLFESTKWDRTDQDNVTSYFSLLLRYKNYPDTVREIMTGHYHHFIKINIIVKYSHKNSWKNKLDQSSC